MKIEWKLNGFPPDIIPHVPFNITAFAVSFAPTARDASAFLLFTAVWERTAAKYGDFGYLHAVIEAGHMAQNVLLVASALKIAACPLGGFDEKIAASILDLDNETEQPMYAIALQRTASDQKERSQ